jgi:hypothetical protein
VCLQANLPASRLVSPLDSQLVVLRANHLDNQLVFPPVNPVDDPPDNQPDNLLDSQPLVLPDNRLVNLPASPHAAPPANQHPNLPDNQPPNRHDHLQANQHHNPRSQQVSQRTVRLTRLSDQQGVLQGSRLLSQQANRAVSQHSIPLHRLVNRHHLHLLTFV